MIGSRLAFRLLGCLSLALACASCQPGLPAVVLNETFSLSPGQSTRVRDERIEVGFVRVVGDSRCPEGAQCIQAGEAVAQLWAREPDTVERNTFEARVRGMVQGPDSTSAQAEVGSYRIQLLELRPYPKANTPVDSTSYVARLRVTRR